MTKVANKVAETAEHLKNKATEAIHKGERTAAEIGDAAKELAAKAAKKLDTAKKKATK